MTNPSVNVTINDKAVVDALHKIQGATVMGVLELAARGGALPMQNQAKINAPKDTGNLARTIHSEVIKRTANEVTVSVGTDAVYAKIQEYGGVIVPRNKRLLAWQDKGGAWHFARRVTLRAQPYMRPAFDSKSAEARAIAFRIILEKAGLS